MESVLYEKENTSEILIISIRPVLSNMVATHHVWLY